MQRSRCTKRDRSDSLDRVNGAGLSHAALKVFQTMLPSHNQMDLGWANGTDDRESHGGRLGERVAVVLKVTGHYYTNG
jgi:hypothetical protein